MDDRPLVMKFGGAAVRSAGCFGPIAALIAARRQAHQKIIAVVSAMGETTRWLHDLALRVSATPPPRELDMLLTVGERVSISLLAMALAEQQCSAVSFTGSQSGIITSDDHNEARILDVRPWRLENALSEGKVAIVAGYQGVSEEREITTLGLGGSDITAVALGAALGAERIEFYKDVDGIYSLDPKQEPSAELLPRLTYDRALQIAQDADHAVLHPRAIALAQANGLPLYLGLSWVGADRPPATPLRIFEKNCSTSGCQ